MTRPRDAEWNDEETLLLARIGEGDAAAYRELVARYGPRLHQYALRLTRNAAEAEDITQETWLRVWTRASEYRPTARVVAWLYRIAHNLAVDRLRARGRWNELDEEEAAPTSTAQPALLEAKRDAQALHRALARLPARQTAALSLVHLNGLSPVEAQSVLGVSPEALESLLARGRRSLKSELESQREAFAGEPT